MKIRFVILAAMLFSALKTGAEFVTLTTPPNAVTQLGNIEIVPFQWPIYQQWFDASMFSSIPGGATQIQDIAFRVSPQSHSFSSTLVGPVMIQFSTTTRTLSSLSPIYTENVGNDNQVFSPYRELSFSSGGAGIHAWTLSAHSQELGKGFFYDPSKGNLLMTVYGLTLPPADVRIGLDGIRGSPLMGSVQFPDGNGEHGVVSSDAFVMLMAFTVPEPSTFALFLLGFIGLISRPYLRRKESHVTA
ncbi:MAG: PEP-CTERM sorting domain-containing protein [Verrucomicrobia bacterium]|nr:PEP-CTERM sorting domain-containing protein [Verrucomicrobiota bacterium]